MNTFAKRLVQASALEAATPRQLDIAASIMFRAFGEWDRQKEIGKEGEGILTWLSRNPKIKAFKGLTSATLEYRAGTLTVELGFRVGRERDTVVLTGKTWAQIRVALQGKIRSGSDSPAMQGVQEAVLRTLLKTRATT